MHSGSRWRRSLAALGVVAATCLGTVQAAPVSFQVSPVAFTPGAGYGVDLSEGLGATLLDVDFAVDTGFQSFSLATAGDAHQFQFGRITLREEFIRFAETDDLGVAAHFLFLDPLVGVRTLTANGIARFGSIDDLRIDFAIDWAPILVAFGDGGVFSLNMDTQRFNLSGQTQDATATVRLLAAPLTVPEPGSLALAGLALLACAWPTSGLRRRTARRV